jgi:Protein of unknown function (DUF2778)
MQGTDATFDEVSFVGGDSSRRALQKLLPGAAAVALAGAVGVWALHLRETVGPQAGYAPWARSAPAAETGSKPFADIAIDAHLLAELKRGAPAGSSSQMASLEAAPSSSYAPIPLPSLEAIPPTPAIPQVERAPVPPTNEGPELGETPLPPPRPPELGAPSAPARHPAQPNVATAPPSAPVDNRSIFERLLGLGRQSAPGVASAAPESGVAGRAVASASVASAASAASEGRGVGRGPLFSLPSPFGGSAPVSGYDRYTAVYDISARTLYMPDGTKLEAHSGLGDALDDPRYVNQRARGPTPPHLYELTLREGSFHGVQALRLNPIGEGGLYGRAGLLAHPFMLGPNGDSNGCVSVKDYEAFLRAYQNGQIKKLVVVAKL